MPALPMWLLLQMLLPPHAGNVDVAATATHMMWLLMWSLLLLLLT